MTTKIIPTGSQSVFYGSSTPSETLVNNATITTNPSAQAGSFVGNDAITIYEANGITLVNTGVINSTYSGLTGYGARFIGTVGQQISITNAATGTIEDTGGEGTGVGLVGGTLVNYGFISGGPGVAGGTNYSDGVQIGGNGGFISNASTGTIAGGGIVGVGLTTLVNAGKVLGFTASDAKYGAILLQLGGSITNLNTGTISAENGAYGIKIVGAGGVVTNAGYIDGGSKGGDAVTLASGFTNRVIVDPGAKFRGIVDGGGSATSTLELGSAAGTGTLSGFGSEYTNFGTLTFDPSASWLVKSNAGITSAVIGGFGAGDTIDIAGFVAVSGSIASNTLASYALVLTDASSAQVTLHFQGGSLTASNFSIGGDGGGGTALIFDAGTVASLACGQTIDEAGILATSETVSAGVMTLRDSGNAIVGTIVVGSSLSSGDFTLMLDSGGTGTDVIVSTVFGTYTSGVTLLTNPTTIASTASVSGSVDSTTGIYGPPGTSWVLTNLGVVSETGDGSDGVSFASAGTVINAATIAGGVIAGGGIVLAAGGSVTNLSTGTISGYDGITAQNASATVVNAGIVTGDPAVNSDSAFGVALGAGGSVTNQSSGTISAFHYGVGISGAAGTVFNLGHINSGSVNNAIAGVYLLDGGEATNGQSGGTVSSAYIASYRYAIRIGSANAGTITNFGTLNGESNVGARVVNGVIVNGPSGATGALIEGGAKAVYVDGTGTVVNYGTILGSESSHYWGVKLDGAGSVANLGTASLIDAYIGVYGQSDDTVTNAGTILSGFGPAGVAVEFHGGTNRLIVEPGAVFTGGLSAAGTTTLELASAASAGTLTGVAITNFTSLVFDTGAQWTVAGSASASGFGTLGITGFTFGDTIDLTGFAAVSRTFASDALVLTNSADARVTLAIQSSLATVNFQISSDGNGGTYIDPQIIRNYGDTIDEAGIVVTSETVTAGVMTLKNGASTVGTIVVGPTLSTGDFILRPDGSTGTDVIVSSIVGTYTSGVTLVINPTSIAGTASITGGVTSAIGVTGLSGTAWTLTNQGLVSETGAGSEGISFASNGSIINAGVVSGAAIGIRLNAGGLVSNQSGGTISGVRGIYDRTAVATIVNSGSISGNVTSGSGIAINAGGSVTNLAGGTISGSYGVNAASVAATVVNAGSIGDGTSLPTGAAIALKRGGLITNQAGGQIIAGLQGIYIGGAAGAIVNAGSVGGGPTAGNGIIFASVGAVTNQSGGVITGKYGVRAVSGAVTVTNAGSIGGNLASGGGVNLAAGGSVTNQSGGTITGLKAVLVTGGAVLNAGSIGGNTVVGTGAGVQLSAGGSFTNQSGGAVTGFAGVFSNAPATVVNAGSIGGNLVSGRGVSLTGSGSVTNQAGGVITGFDGIFAAGGATVVNAGSIGGTTAVAFGSGVTNRLVIDPGARFSGTVDGGNTIGAGLISTLELASGASAGTLSGLGSQFIDFARTTIDANANWILIGTNSLVAGASLTNSGTLTDTGTLFNSGTLTGNKLRLNGGVLTNQASGVLTATYVYGVAAGGIDIVVNQGIIDNNTAAAIYLKASGTVTNAAGGAINGYGDGVRLGGALASVSNLGQITGTSLLDNGYGVYLRNGGVVTNGQAGAGTSTASIRSNYGVTFKGAAGTVGNYGTITGTGRTAVDLGNNGGSVVNGASGAAAALIEGGAYGVYTGAGSVANYASIIATGIASHDYGVAINTTGNVSNLGAASLIEGYGGVQIGTDGTVTNAGTIASNQGASGVAVDFTDGNARLIDDPGAVFIGSIFGGTGGTAVMELATGSSAGTISGFDGISIANFTSLVFDPGALWTVTGNASAAGLGGLGIAGFDVGDTIDLTGFVAVSKTFSSNSLVLTDGIGDHATLAIQSGFSTGNFRIAGDGASGGAAGTDITLNAAVPPVITGTAAGQAVNDNATDQPFSAVTVSDANTGDQSETVTITVTEGGSATDADGTLSGIGLSKTGIGTYTVSASSAGAATTVLNALVFAPTTHQVVPGATVTTGFTLDDIDTAGATVSDSTTTVIATAVNDAPVVVGTVAGQTVADNAIDQPFSAATISDPDVGAAETVTITLTAGGVASDANGLLSGTGLSQTGIGVYTLVAGTPDAVTAALQALVFTPAAHEVPSGGTVTTGMTLSVTDGIAGTPTTDATTTVVATAINDVPTISGTVGGQTVNDNGTDQPFLAATISDPDAGAAETVTITLTAGGVPSDANGLLSGTGLSKIGIGVYALATDTPDAVTAALRALVFTPAAHEVPPGGAVTIGMTLSVTDGITGTPTTDLTTTVVATAINDAPVIAGVAAGQTVNDNATDQPFSATTVSDPDAGAVEIVTITLTAGGAASDANGLLSGTGLSKIGTGVYVLAADTPAAVTAALRALVFTPVAHEVPPGSTVTTGMTLSVADGIAGTPTSDATTTVVATAAFSLPSIGGTIPNQAVPNQTASTPFSAVVVTDPSFGATDTLTVTLSAPGNGTFTNLSGGSYDASTGIYNLTGTPVVLTAALEALVFTPLAQPGAFVTTTGFTLAVQGLGGSSSDSTTSVSTPQQILGLGTVPSNTLTFSVSPDGSSFAAPVSGMTNEAVVSNPVSGGIYTVPAGFQALFLDGTANTTLSDDSVGNAILTANQGDNLLTANISGDVLVAGSGTDTLVAGVGTATLIGGTGPNVMFAGSGSGIILGGAGASTVSGGSGPLTMFAGSGAIQAVGGTGSLVFVGGTSGGDTVSGGSGATTLAGGSGNNVLIGGSGTNLMSGGVGNDTMAGGSSASTLAGGGGNNILFGGSGSNVMFGGTGNATLAGGSGASTMDGSSGNNVIFGGIGPDVIFGGSGTDTIAGGAGQSTVSAGSGPMTVFAGSGAMLVFGGSGPLVFVGGATGGSTVVGGSGASTLFGGAGSDNTLFAGGGASTLVGGIGSTTMVGGSGTDVMFGGSGPDSMFSGTGNAVMNAGSGADLFVFINGSAGGTDVILNFSHGPDQVALGNYAANVVPSALAGAVTASGSTTITLSDNTRITFAGISQLTASDFV